MTEKRCLTMFSLKTKIVCSFSSLKMRGDKTKLTLIPSTSSVVFGGNKRILVQIQATDSNSYFNLVVLVISEVTFISTTLFCITSR